MTRYLHAYEWSVVAVIVLTAVLGLSPPAARAQLPPVPAGTEKGDKPQPKLVVAQRSIDLGKVTQGDVVEVTWRLENQGAAPIEIERTQSSCGCTVVQLSAEDKVIPPGGSVDLKAQFDTKSRRGTQRKVVTIWSNDPAEPTMKLDFTAEIDVLFTMQPDTILNLRSVRRGVMADQAIDLYPVSGGSSIEIADVELADDAPVRLSTESFEHEGLTGQRIRVTVSEAVGQGTFTTPATIRLNVGDVRRERTVVIRGSVIGDLSWHPKVLDATRQPATAGRRFAPVTITSTAEQPFELLEANAGPYFDVAYDAANPRSRTRYNVVVTLREGAPPGPFGAMLEVRTSLLDYPVVRVPVFGIVAEPVEVDPPIVVLRKDGTELGMERRVKLQVLPQMRLEVSNLTCDSPAVSATLAADADRRYHHIRFLEVKLVGTLAPGTHRATLSVSTTVPGASHLEIPVVIEVPDS